MNAATMVNRPPDVRIVIEHLNCDLASNGVDLQTLVDSTGVYVDFHEKFFFV